MQLNVIVTLIATAVLMLISTCTTMAATSTNTPTTSTSTTAATAIKQDSIKYNFSLSITRSTSLIDFQDGTRSDEMGYEFKPSAVFSWGGLSGAFAYNQDLRDSESTQAGLNDSSITLALNPTKLNWLKEKNTKITYSFTGVIPLSKGSTQKDNLQTALSARTGISLLPIGGEGFGCGAGISLGRNFHSYEEDINGSVLNQYSSNQNLNISYTTGNWSLSFDYINRTRWTYKNNIKSSFEIVEEIGYGFNDNLSLALGHTNGGSTLKANASDSNIDLFNENSSVVYMTLGLTY